MKYATMLLSCDMFVFGCNKEHSLSVFKETEKSEKFCMGIQLLCLLQALGMAHVKQVKDAWKVQPDMQDRKQHQRSRVRVCEGTGGTRKFDRIIQVGASAVIHSQKTSTYLDQGASNKNEMVSSQPYAL